MDKRKEYWVPATSHGWGWGTPHTWQGQLVLVAYVASIVAAAVAVPPQVRPAQFFVVLGALTFAVLAVCWFKGEPPAWRWGRNK